VVTDGVFSAHGNVVKLDELKAIAKKYNASIFVDDAHGFGVMGQKGQGTVHYFNAQDDVDLIICTFSKTLASLGGFVAGPERVINYLKHKSPALIFSASPTPASVAAASAALDILIAQPELAERVRRNADRVRQGLRESGFNVIEGEAAIVPVIIGDDERTFGIWKMLYDEGVFVNAFISPATSPGMQMLRTSYMATHEDEHLDFIIDKFRKIGKKLGLLNRELSNGVHKS
jgi:8-amino-7-oxononanoate synthase